MVMPVNSFRCATLSTVECFLIAQSCFPPDTAATESKKNTQRKTLENGKKMMMRVGFEPTRVALNSVLDGVKHRRRNHVVAYPSGFVLRRYLNLLQWT